MIKTVIFLGPSLPHECAKEILNGNYQPPIKRGDIPIVLEKGFDQIAIIDGEFGQSLSVAVTEIRKALAAGVKIWGAASMGALRAVECRNLGMKGVGWIFSQYQDGILESDDEVALIFNPYTLKPMSEPRVNMRWALECAVEKKILTKAEALKILELALQIHFQELTYESLKQLGKENSCLKIISKLVDFVSNDRSAFDRKRLDAIELLTILNKQNEELS